MMRVLHYVNQFFGQVGGEEVAGIGPSLVDRPLGPGLLLERLLGTQGKVIGTIICGDNYFAERGEAAALEILDLLSPLKFDVLVAGPAFNAGRYGLACGLLCKSLREKLGIPAVTGMFPGNPGADLYRKYVRMVETSANVSGMSKAMPGMVRLALKLWKAEPLGSPEQEGTIPRGIKRTVRSEKLASERAIEMLLRKMKGEPFRSEITVPGLDRVAPAPPVGRISEAVIALVTEGGLVPRGNPDGLETARATRYAGYPLEELENLGAGGFQSIHRGFDTTFVNEDPDRLVPVDVMREFERERVFKGLHPTFFVTTGVATTLDYAKKIGRGIAGELRSAGVSAAIVTST